MKDPVWIAVFAAAFVAERERERQRLKSQESKHFMYTDGRIQELLTESKINFAHTARAVADDTR